MSKEETRKSWIKAPVPRKEMCVVCNNFQLRKEVCGVQQFPNKKRRRMGSNQEEENIVCTNNISNQENKYVVCNNFQLGRKEECGQTKKRRI